MGWSSAKTIFIIQAIRLLALSVCMSASTALAHMVVSNPSTEALLEKLNGNCLRIGKRNDVGGLTREVIWRLDGELVEIDPAYRDSQPPELRQQQFHAGYGQSILRPRSVATDG